MKREQTIPVKSCLISVGIRTLRYKRRHNDRAISRLPFCLCCVRNFTTYWRGETSTSIKCTKNLKHFLSAISWRLKKGIKKKKKKYGGVGGGGGGGR